MNREGRTVNVKDWGRLGAKRVVLYEDRGELRFTDGFHDMRMTQARMEAFVPGGDAGLFLVRLTACRGLLSTSMEIYLFRRCFPTAWI